MAGKGSFCLFTMMTTVRRGNSTVLRCSKLLSHGKKTFKGRIGISWMERVC